MLNSSAFKNILCVTTLLSAQSVAFGMEKTVDPAHELGESLTITERSQLLSITPEQAKKIKSLRIENQVIDDEVRFKLLLCGDDLYSIYFVGCNFFERGWQILNCVPTVSEIGFVHCLSSVDDLERLLSALYPYHPTEVLDLTGNRLGDDPLRFVKCLSRNVFNFKSLSKLVISGNGFCSSILPLLNDASDSCLGEIVL